ncbi:CvpA family protein [Seonamhaeicola sp. ML3]|uniref:CvpA family protein n=1 Tax=Seonamhaeicola sp. ML3 TaxID=2937786 RepID=UPI00200D5DD2|nr:CvpA family protein [Seonamhaeicola sp. ML3]
MGVIDIVLGALILFGLIRGLMKGLFVEVASLVALIAGVYGAIHFSNYAADFLVEKVEWDQKYINIVAFAVTFIVIVLAIALAGKALTKIADFAALGFINKILGGVFGAAKIAMILSIVLIIFDKFNKTIPFADEADLEASVLYRPVKSLVPTIFPYILEFENKEPLDSEEENKTT